MLEKVSKRYYIIFLLAKIGMAQREVVIIHCAVVRNSILEHSCAVRHCDLTAAQLLDTERVQKRCMQIIYSELSYDDAVIVRGRVKQT